jgi:hypothetical protein
VCTTAQLTSEQRGYDGDTMRFIHLFLVGYFVVILGVGVGLWQAGVFDHVAPVWVVVGSLLAVGVGIMLAVSSGKPTATEPSSK